MATSKDSRNKPERYTLVTGSNQLNPNYWVGNKHVSQEDLSEAVDDAVNDPKALFELMTKSLEGSFAIKDAYFIIHDKDDSKPHVHWLIRSVQGHSKKAWKKALCLLEEYCVQIPEGSKKFMHDNCLAYLIHIKEEKKHHYLPSDVYTAKGENYSEIFNSRESDWAEGADIKRWERESSKEQQNYLFNMITSGKVTMDEVMNTDSLYNIFRWNPSRFQTAFQTYYERCFRQYQKGCREGKFEVPTVFIDGLQDGLGKSELALKAMKLIEDRSLEFANVRWTHYDTGSGSHGHEKYEAQQGMFMDDASAQLFDFKGWVNFLDPKKRVAIDGRFTMRNLCHRYTIITSVSNPFQYFLYEIKKSVNNDSERFGQVLRRISLYAHVFHIGSEYEEPNDDNTFVAIYFQSKVPETCVSVPHTQTSRANNPGLVEKKAIVSYNFDEDNVFIVKTNDAAKIIAQCIIDANKYDVDFGIDDITLYSPRTLEKEFGYTFDYRITKPQELPSSQNVITVKNEVSTETILVESTSEDLTDKTAEQIEDELMIEGMDPFLIDRWNLDTYLQSEEYQEYERVMDMLFSSPEDSVDWDLLEEAYEASHPGGEVIKFPFNPFKNEAEAYKLATAIPS